MNLNGWLQPVHQQHHEQQQEQEGWVAADVGGGVAVVGDAVAPRHVAAVHTAARTMLSVKVYILRPA